MRRQGGGCPALRLRRGDDPHLFPHSRRSARHGRRRAPPGPPHQPCGIRRGHGHSGGGRPAHGGLWPADQGRAAPGAHRLRRSHPVRCRRSLWNGGRSGFGHGRGGPRPQPGGAGAAAKLEDGGPHLGGHPAGRHRRRGHPGAAEAAGPVCPGVGSGLPGAGRHAGCHQL